MRSFLRGCAVLLVLALGTPVGDGSAAATEAMVLDVCPNDYGGFPPDGPSLTCGCTPDAVKTGDVLGANPYYYQSSTCRAAVHAGLLGSQGGQLVITPAPAAVAFPAVTRNGIVGRSWRGGRDNPGFLLATVPGSAPVVAGATPLRTSAAGMVLDVCPSDYSGFPADAPSLTCGCTPDAVKAGDVLGANPYYYQSSACRAALHAGVVGLKGGTVILTPAPVVPVYPGVTRNGFASRSWRGGADNPGFKLAALPGAAPVAAPVSAAPKPMIDASGQPVQAPVAETLRSAGQVALYIRFRFNSADLDISGAPTLMQLHQALVAAPDVRLLLVGHTDAVGGRDYNRSLSLKRARSVMLWLRDQGIPAERLAIDGKGFDEPAADNDTESGRALNRRVQAIRIR